MNTRKFIAMLLLVAMLAMGAAFAKNIQLKGDAYLYKGAGTGKTSIILKRGSVVACVGDHIGSKNTKIKLSNGEQYWVRSKYVRGFSEKKVNEVYGAGGTGKAKSSTETVSEAKGEKLVIVWKKLNMRTKPGLDGKPLSPSLKKGWIVKTEGKKSTDERGQVWHYVSYKGVKGWISEGSVEW